MTVAHLQLAPVREKEGGNRTVPPDAPSLAHWAEGAQ